MKKKKTTFVIFCEYLKNSTTTRKVLLYLFNVIQNYKVKKNENKNKGSIEPPPPRTLPGPFFVLAR